MCGPAAAPFVMAAGAVLGAVGNFQAGQAQKASLKTEAALADRQEMLTLQAAGYESNRRKEALNKLTGEQAALAAGNVELSGSFLDTVADSRREGLLDLAAAEWGAKIKASDFAAEAKAKRRAANQAGIGSYISAAQPLLSFGGSDSGVKLGQSLFGGAKGKGPYG